MNSISSSGDETSNGENHDGSLMIVYSEDRESDGNMDPGISSWDEKLSRPFELTASSVSIESRLPVAALLKSSARKFTKCSDPPISGVK